MLTSYRLAVVLMVVFGTVGIMAARHESGENFKGVDHGNVAAQGVDTTLATPTSGNQPAQQKNSSGMNGSIDRISAPAESRIAR